MAVKNREVRTRFDASAWSTLETLKVKTGAHSYCAVLRMGLKALEREVNLLNQRQVMELKHVRSQGK